MSEEEKKEILRSAQDDGGKAAQDDGRKAAQDGGEKPRGKRILLRTFGWPYVEVPRDDIEVIKETK